MRRPHRFLHKNRSLCIEIRCRFRGEILYRAVFAALCFYFFEKVSFSFFLVLYSEVLWRSSLSKPLKHPHLPNLEFKGPHVIIPVLPKYPITATTLTLVSHSNLTLTLVITLTIMSQITPRNNQNPDRHETGATRETK